MSWTKCERLTSEPREILTSQQGINEPPMAVIHNLRNQVGMVGMPPLDPVDRMVTTENVMIVKHLTTVGMTIGAMAPEIPIDIHMSRNNHTDRDNPSEPSDDSLSSDNSYRP